MRFEFDTVGTLVVVTVVIALIGMAYFFATQAKAKGFSTSKAIGIGIVGWMSMVTLAVALVYTLSSQELGQPMAEAPEIAGLLGVADGQAYPVVLGSQLTGVAPDDTFVITSMTTGTSGNYRDTEPAPVLVVSFTHNHRPGAMTIPFSDLKIVESPTANPTMTLRFFKDAGTVSYHVTQAYSPCAVVVHDLLPICRHHVINRTVADPLQDGFTLTNLVRTSLTSAELTMTPKMWAQLQRG